MAVVPAIAIWLVSHSSEILLFFIPAPEPGEFLFVSHRFFAAIFVPFDVGSVAQDSNLLLLFRVFVGGSWNCHACQHEGPDVHSHAVVEIGMPADGLL